MNDEYNKKDTQRTYFYVLKSCYTSCVFVCEN